ncbi:MAG: MBL fold metallo-hydrolase [Acidobacteriota bacterium]|nr:MAG: MBL fold metallo-hydrolase [Acidobacteriota bacterium]
MDFGNLEVHLISDGTFWLDGGAMFGVVPKVFWSKALPSDDRNRVHLGLNALLIRSEEGTLLVDTGCGEKYTDKQRDIYGLGPRPQLLDELSRLGCSPEDISLVLNTHLHFDHCGGNTRLGESGIVPTFPNARFLVQKQEFDDACSANERTRGSYFPENWECLVQRGQLQLIDGEHEVLPGIQCVPTPGHTLGHQSIKIVSGGKTLFFMADLCPTQAHVPLPWIMAYDLYPMTTLETRRRIYQEAVDGQWLLCFQHDATRPLGVLFREGDRIQIAEQSFD